MHHKLKDVKQKIWSFNPEVGMKKYMEKKLGKTENRDGNHLERKLEYNKLLIRIIFQQIIHFHQVKRKSHKPQ